MTKRKKDMKNIVKLAIGAAMLGGLSVAAVAPANAGVSVGVGIGVPGPGYAHPHGAWCYHHPHRCGYRAGYYGPGYVGPAPAIGVYYSNRGWWDGHRYWGHRYAYHGGWRYR
jgi:hypothetical protein